MMIARRRTTLSPPSPARGQIAMGYRGYGLPISEVVSEAMSA